MESGSVNTRSLDQISDAELMARVAGRGPEAREAFEQLYDRYAGRAFGLALRLTGDRATSEEVTQEAFWRAWQAAGSFDPARASLSSWLLAIVHHCAVDELRRQRSRGTPIELDRPEGETQSITDPEADTAEHAWANVQSAHVQAALARLPEAQRVVIELAYFGGYTRQEIAQRLNEPLGTVHTRARLGLIKLKELLASLQT